MLYSSLQNPKIKEICKLRQKKYRDQTSLFMVEGKTGVIEAYKKGVLKSLLLREGKTIDIDFPKDFVTDSVMQKITSLESIPYVIGICKKKETHTYGNRIVVLEDVQDPGNIGTIIRSAVAFHVDTIILSKACADPYSPKVQRACQGMAFHINIVVATLSEILPKLREKSIPIYGTKVNGGKEVFHLYKGEKFAIIMGNEGQGLSQEALTFCDDFLYIPMSSLCESLNVGVATSILLYELDKKG